MASSLDNWWASLHFLHPTLCPKLLDPTCPILENKLNDEFQEGLTFACYFWFNQIRREESKRNSNVNLSSVTGNYDPASLTFFIKGFNYPAVNNIS